MKNNIKNDKVSVTIEVPEDNKLLIKDNLYDHAKKRTYGARYSNNRKHILKTRYGNMYTFKIPTWKMKSHLVVIMIYPRNKEHNFVKVVFNPSKLNRDGKILLRRLLIKILGISIVRAIYYEGRLSRLDMAIDNHDISGDDYMYMKGAGTSKIVPNEYGQIGSQIIGSGASNVRTTIYDKANEQRINLELEEYKSWHRLEIRIRNLSFSMSEIQSKLKNNFNRVCFYRSDFLINEYFEQEFRDKAFDVGLNSAFHKMDPNKRRRYLRHLDKHHSCNPFNLQEQCLDSFMHSLNFLKSKSYALL